MKNLLALLLAFTIAALAVPVIQKVSVLTGAYAKENNRTIHHGKISRIGGIALYLGTVLPLAFLMETDKPTLGIYLASSLMFFTGLADDYFDLKPKIKLFFQLIAACILIRFGVRAESIHLPFGIVIDNSAVSILFTLVWVVGITNAVNLTDGLDGLAGGMSLIFFGVICAISLVDRRTDITSLSMIVMGALLGFLIYNAHPASLFMGDCGALFLGCLIASVSLLGFRSSTVVTLALPILILILPIVDTLSAIMRRKLQGKDFSQADRSHLHHQLLDRFGHRNTVIIMCGITFLFGMCAFLYISSRTLGMAAIFVLLIAVDLFIEKTGMISRHYRPVLSVLYNLLSRKKTGS